ncbi:MAG: PRC-barrel domain-containing protein [Hyphomicrobium sp.]|nr:PRC-barrel domain-containing protein [Hyphomicrobium sp.]
MTFTRSTATAAVAAAVLSVSAFASIAQVAQPREGPASVEAAPAPAATPETSETPSVDAAATTAANLTAKDLPIGSAVFGNDGQQIGEINRVTSEPSGTVVEIQVTTGSKAGLNADVVAISAEKISAVGNGVKLTLSSQEAKSLPVLDNGNG